jgi:hypothetical protein
MRLALLYGMTVLLGLLLSKGVGTLVGLQWPAAELPVIILLSLWWMWIGWRYVSARDRARRQTSN